MEWVMLELIRNPTVLEKVQREVREALGKTETMLVSEEKMTTSTMSYFQMVIKETLWLHPPGPLLLPRENREKCQEMGYEVPAKMTVMVNAWVIGRDSKYWEDPEEFKSERFDKLPA
ncbi:hypothetical protein HPP92_028390 [Vanilla planifolia]|nr:hypothetical protein HPP92_028390 [Vanilla planifolia]